MPQEVVLLQTAGAMFGSKAENTRDLGAYSGPILLTLQCILIQLQGKSEVLKDRCCRFSSFGFWLYLGSPHLEGTRSEVAPLRP